MAEIMWNDSMLVNVAEIDSQHKQLTETINALYYAYMDGTDAEHLSKIINDINDYAKYHFATEEKYMLQFQDNYPTLGFHLEKHSEFFSTAIDFLFKYVEGQEEITPELLDYLMDWWFKHINGIDKSLGAFLNERGIY